MFYPGTSVRPILTGPGAGANVTSYFRQYHYDHALYYNGCIIIYIIVTNQTVGLLPSDLSLISEVTIFELNTNRRSYGAQCFS